MSSAEREFWRDRFLHYGGQAGTLLVRITEVMTVGVAVLVSVFAALVGSESFVVLLAVPPIAVLAWAMCLRLMHEQALLSAMRDYAEERWAKSAGVGRTGEAPLRIWHSSGGDHSAQGHPQGVLFATLVVLTTLVVVGSLGFGVAASLAAGLGTLAAVAVATTLILIALLLVAARSMTASVEALYAPIKDEANRAALGLEPGGWAEGVSPWWAGRGHRLPDRAPSEGEHAP